MMMRSKYKNCVCIQKKHCGMEQEVDLRFFLSNFPTNTYRTCQQIIICLAWIRLAKFAKEYIPAGICLPKVTNRNFKINNEDTRTTPGVVIAGWNVVQFPAAITPRRIQDCQTLMIELFAKTVFEPLAILRKSSIREAQGPQEASDLFSGQ